MPKRFGTSLRFTGTFICMSKTVRKFLNGFSQSPTTMTSVMCRCRCRRNIQTIVLRLFCLSFIAVELVSAKQLEWLLCCVCGVRWLQSITQHASMWRQRLFHWLHCYAIWTHLSFERLLRDPGMSCDISHYLSVVWLHAFFVKIDCFRTLIYVYGSNKYCVMGYHNVHILRLCQVC